MHNTTRPFPAAGHLFRHGLPDRRHHLGTCRHRPCLYRQPCLSGRRAPCPGEGSQVSNCPICGHPPYSPPFRLCADCLAHHRESGTSPMPEGHNRQQERAQNGVLRYVLPKPRPRRPLETERQETASQRFLRRFGAGDTLAPTKTTPRAMKNPPFTASAFPSAYVPSPKVAGGVFSSSAFRLLPPVVFRVAVPVTPPLCLIRETFPQKSLSSRTVKGASDAS